MAALGAAPVVAAARRLVRRLAAVAVLRAVALRLVRRVAAGAVLRRAARLGR